MLKKLSFIALHWIFWPIPLGIAQGIVNKKFIDVLGAPIFFTYLELPRFLPNLLILIIAYLLYFLAKKQIKDQTKMIIFLALLGLQIIIHSLIIPPTYT